MCCWYWFAGALESGVSGQIETGGTGGTGGTLEPLSMTNACIKAHAAPAGGAT